MKIENVDQARWDELRKLRILFGHKSVGRDIVAGVRLVLLEHPNININVVTTKDPNSVKGPGFISTEVGENRKPESKDKAFANILESGFASEGDIAMYKYCYVDMLTGTEPISLFDSYRSNIERLSDKYRRLNFIPVTMPLCTPPRRWTERFKTAVGRPTQTRMNAARAEFNRLLRKRYADSKAIFDIAEFESIGANGLPAHSQYRAIDVPMLAAEWTHDGGHLIVTAQKLLAERLLVLLSALA